MTTGPSGQIVYVAGQTQGTDGFRALTLAYDAATGEQRWAAVDGRAGDEYDPTSAIAVAPDGCAVYTAGAACGVITDGSTCDVMLVARDAATGTQRWPLFRDGQGRGLDSAQAVAVSADSSVVYIGGQTYS